MPGMDHSVLHLRSPVPALSASEGPGEGSRLDQQQRLPADVAGVEARVNDCDMVLESVCAGKYVSSVSSKSAVIRYNPACFVY